MTDCMTDLYNHNLSATPNCQKLKKRAEQTDTFSHGIDNLQYGYSQGMIMHAVYNAIR